MSRRTAKERDATRLAMAITHHKPVFMNRFVGLSVISECDTQMYVLTLISQYHNKYSSNPSTMRPLIVTEGDMTWINAEALRKNSYDRGLLRRTGKRLENIRQVRTPDIYTLAQYGATGMVMGLEGKRTPMQYSSIKAMDDLQKMTGPAWWDDISAMISYNLANNGD